MGFATMVTALTVRMASTAVIALTAATPLMTVIVWIVVAAIMLIPSRLLIIPSYRLTSATVMMVVAVVADLVAVFSVTIACTITVDLALPAMASGPCLARVALHMSRDVVALMSAGGSFISANVVATNILLNEFHIKMIASICIF